MGLSWWVRSTLWEPRPASEGEPANEKRVRNCREVDSDIDFEEESTVLDENNAGPVAKAWRTFQFISPIIPNMQVVVKMHHASRVRGLETQLVWAISKETHRLSPEGIPYCATKQTDVSVMYATLHMGLDGLLSSSAWSEAASVSTPTHSAVHWSQSLRATTAMSLYPYHQESGGHRPEAVSLRQAFTTLLGSTLSRNHLFVACGGESPTGRTGSGPPDGRGRHSSMPYNDFVDYLSDPSKQIDMRGSWLRQR
ncbi:hypothetical protein J4Q44_G00017530 [Coregonus suidteri]|uniref:Uncharacterized protein n=1 Tax=Coregonus suidteri TaxID=861788 RepID=A0AAN8MGD8_9TELE